MDKIRQFINYRMFISGDFNSRIKELIGDKAYYISGLERFIPFLEQNNLIIRNPKNTITCKNNKGTSIVDYVLTDNNDEWSTIYNIDIIINGTKFKCNENKTSHHKSLIIKLKINCNKIKPKRYNDKIHKSLFRKTPKYKYQITRDESN